MVGSKTAFLRQRPLLEMDENLVGYDPDFARNSGKSDKEMLWRNWSTMRQMSPRKFLSQPKERAQSTMGIGPEAGSRSIKRLPSHVGLCGRLSLGLGAVIGHEGARWSSSEAVLGVASDKERLSAPSKIETRSLGAGTVPATPLGKETVGFNPRSIKKREKKENTQFVGSP